MDLVIFILGWLAAAVVGYAVGANRPYGVDLPYSATCTVCGDFKVNSNDLDALEQAMTDHQENGECDG